MRILHVSNFTIKWNGIHFWAMPYRLTNGLIREGHHVVTVCDRDIADSRYLGIRALGVGYANEKILAACRTIKPDLLLLGHCTLIAPQTIAAAKQALPGLRVAHWNCDPFFDANNLARLEALAPLADASFVTSAGPDLQGLRRLGRAYFMPNPIDPAIDTGRAHEAETLPYDLFFASSPNREKERLAKAIMQRLPDLAFALYGLFGRPRIEGAEMVAALAQTKMGLNVSRRNDVYLYSSDRMALFMGNGVLTFTDRRTGFERLFGEDALACYDDDAELIDKLAYFAGNDRARRQIAATGWQRAHRLCDARLVARFIVDLTFGHGEAAAYPWMAAAEADAPAIPAPRADG